jgi:uncharacterized membrane protein
LRITGLWSRQDRKSRFINSGNSENCIVTGAVLINGKIFRLLILLAEMNASARQFGSFRHEDTSGQQMLWFLATFLLVYCFFFCAAFSQWHNYERLAHEGVATKDNMGWSGAGKTPTPEPQ